MIRVIVHGIGTSPWLLKLECLVIPLILITVIRSKTKKSLNLFIYLFSLYVLLLLYIIIILSFPLFVLDLSMLAYS